MSSRDVETMTDIFLSYAREDIVQARRLAEALQSRGWSVWWDRHIPHGQDFTAHIQQQLDEARCIVVLWSKTSIKSSFVRDEASEGLNGRLVPLLLEPVKQPLGFRQLHAADLTDWTGQTPHDEFDRLLQSINALIAPRETVDPRETPAALETEPARASPGSAPTEVALAASVSFEADVYVSYTHLDNVELVEGRPGWVTSFRRALEARLSQLLGRSATVWMVARLAGNEPFVDALMDTVRRAACFVAVVSPRYMKSEWMKRELIEFERAAAEQGGMTVSGRSRLFKVLKTPVPLASLPPALQTLLGYEFFQIDPETGKVRELDALFGPDAERDFWLKLDDLAHDISSVLQECPMSES